MIPFFGKAGFRFLRTGSKTDILPKQGAYTQSSATTAPTVGTAPSSPPSAPVDGAVLVVVHTDAVVRYTYTSGAWSEIARTSHVANPVSTDGTQTLSNKTLASPTTTGVTTFGSRRHFVISGTSTDATPVRMLIAGESTVTAPLVLPASSIWLVEASIVARKSDGNASAGWVARALLKRDGSGTTSRVQAAGLLSLGSSGGPPAGWTVEVNVDDTTESVAINATGAAATTIKWEGTVVIHEVKA